VENRGFAHFFRILLKAEFQPNSTTGGPGDRLHPNRAGYAAMGATIDLNMVFGKQR